MGAWIIELRIGPEGTPPDALRLFALGPNKTSKGVFKLDAAGVASVLAAFAKHGMDRMPIDYDHGMFAGGANTKAAGWGVLEARPDGLWLSHQIASRYELEAWPW